MGNLRRILLGALPKLALSRTTGVLARLQLPRALRGPVYRWFARRYGVELGEMQGALADYRSLGEFFVRPLRDGARPIDAHAPLVWPCDGRIVTAGPVRGGRIEQVKGHDYALAELVLDPELAARLDGSQATIYLAPRDYHRVHAPFSGQLVAVRRVPGTFYPVNPQTCRSVEDVFVRNERVVFELRLDDGRAGAVVMVAALNVGDIQPQVRPPSRVARGQEIGRFGLGSTVVALVGPGTPSFPALPAEAVVRCGAAASPDRASPP